MSRSAKRPSTSQKIITALSQLVGLPMTASNRAADMRMFHFGTLRPGARGSIGDFSLHVQCPWRIEGLEGILTGRLDLWAPAEVEQDVYVGEWDCDSSPNLQDVVLEKWLLRKGSSLVVESVDADEFGGA